MNIILTYSNDIETVSKAFRIRSLNSEDYAYERRLHGEALNGSYAESPVGYRRLVTIVFEPLLADKEKLFFLYAWCIAKSKYVLFYVNSYGEVVDSSEGTETTIAVTLPDTQLRFFHERNASFANVLTLELVEKGTNYIIDDGTVKTLKPVYSPGGEGISGDTCTYLVNLVDESNVEIMKKPLTFLQGEYETKDFGYRHVFTIDFGPLSEISQRQWLRDFFLWRNKRLDTTAIDPLNGKVFTIVAAEERLSWREVAGMAEAKATSVRFIEQAIQTVGEEYNAPPSSEHDFQLDTDQLDDTNAVIG